jgi:hypothetical protein
VFSYTTENFNIGAKYPARVKEKAFPVKEGFHKRGRGLGRVD